MELLGRTGSERALSTLLPLLEGKSDPALAETPKFAWWDEGWKFLAEPTLGAYIEEAFRTWRKLHGAMIPSTGRLLKWSRMKSEAFPTGCLIRPTDSGRMA